MATVLEIKFSNNVNIRTKVLPSSILKTADADMRDVVANELRNRGVIQADDTGDLAAISIHNTRLALVYDVGFFVAIETGDAADNENAFASADAGWLWVKVASVEPIRDKFTIDEDHEYEITDGIMIYEIWMKSAIEQEGVKIGTTDGGDEIMLSDTLAAGEWKVVSKKVFADGGDVSIFITGISEDTTVIIYKKRI